jgi:hypothetical protein
MAIYIFPHLQKQKTTAAIFASTLHCFKSSAFFVAQAFAV